MKKMFKGVSVLLAIIMLLQVNVVQAEAKAEKNNDYPLVLVHGLAGWGREEGIGLVYWGSTNEDYETMLNEEGIETYTVSVGPFSSNWDRACELYAYLKGGRVDYGKAHSEKHNHDRYGKTFTGIYPQWGDARSDGDLNKIHLIGHSMGGQTSRTVTQMLFDRNEQEVAAICGEGATEAEVAAAIEEGILSPLFAGDRKWVHSCTTISTPHDGTALAHGARKLIPLAKSLLAVMGGVAGGDGLRTLYDFDLEQWGLKRQEGESFSDYNNRIWASEIWDKTKDFSFWDLSIPGAKELNQWVLTQEDVYYFSFATEETYNSLFTRHEIPEGGMNPLFIPSAFYIGSYEGVIDGVDIDSSWFINDGLVSERSAMGPSLGTDTEIEYVDAIIGIPEKGRWNFLGTLDSTDHIDIIGYATPHKKSGWYLALGEYLTALNK